MWDILHRNIERDYNLYKSYVIDRKYLFQSSLEKKLKDVFSFLYMFTLMVDDILNLELDNEIKNYISEVKADLIVSLDLANINYLKGSKQILRSSIEEFFRFCLSIQRKKEYELNKRKGIYTADDSLKKLRSNIDTHKVGKMTHFTCEKFSQTPIESPIKNLVDLYSELSSFVHVNKTENLTAKNFLNEFKEIDQEKSSKFLSIYSQTVDLMTVITIYFYNYYPFNSVLTKRNWLNIKSKLSKTSQKTLETIEHFFNT
ncbi:hypothetical protein [Bacillus smithii]|uniref:hypothetical protein n=1 Tax=Bacillus smithii TaxID=1479 RepID=UPI003D233310